MKLSVKRLGLKLSIEEFEINALAKCIDSYTALVKEISKIKK
jgi:hypothetical protein